MCILLHQYAKEYSLGYICAAMPTGKPTPQWRSSGLSTWNAPCIIHHIPSQYYQVNSHLPHLLPCYLLFLFLHRKLSAMIRHKVIFFYLVVIFGSAALWILSEFLIEPFQSYSERTEPWFSDWHDRLLEGRKIILLYTTWFRKHKWFTFTGRRLYERMEHCENAKNCLLTYDKSWIDHASVVVFHGRDVEKNRIGYWSASRLRKVRSGVPLAQKWVFFSHENPHRDINMYKPYDGLFNWTATFNRKSDIFVSYQGYEEKLEPQKEIRNYAKEKTGLVAWAVSNCNAKLRLEYARQLQRYMSVTVYGKCNCYFEKRMHCAQHANGCEMELSKYKFYLAFENDFCDDYVTEKYWERIRQDVVPVVMGSNYDGLVVPGSYIDVNDFGSIKELAEYLLFLDKNDDEYNKYFTYKRTFTGGSESLFCRICEKLNSEEAKKESEVILSKEFSYENNCRAGRAKSAKFQKQIDNVGTDDDNLLFLTFTNIWCWFYTLF